MGTTSRCGGVAGANGGIRYSGDHGASRGFWGTRRVRSTPPLHSHNRYACLEEEQINDTPFSNESQPLLVVPNPIPKPTRLRRWERKLPRRLVVAATPNGDSLQLRVETQTTDTREVRAVDALLDSGATGLFLDSDYVRQERMSTRELSRPIPVSNVDGTPNGAGPIHQVVDTVLRYKGHTERVIFAVTNLGGQKMILGLPWLREHNPEVDWNSGEVKMSRCPARCRTCQNEIKAEKKVRRAEILRVRTCRAGKFPTADVDWEGVPDLIPDSEECEDEDDPSELEEGDRVFATNLVPRREEIRATPNFSQRLAEAFHRNSAPKDFNDIVPMHLQDFEDVFAKESFDALPERKVWDHAIELVPDAKLSSCKIYPVSVNEQTQLDAFIEESLASGRIRPSKSPMASL
jgi:hypothetical protein